MADHKLVAENSHLLPKTRMTEETMDVEMTAEERQSQPLENEEATRVDGKKHRNKAKRRLLVGGGVEEERMDVDG